MLVSYSKMVLFADIVASNLPDDPLFEQTLMNYFPAAMQKGWKEDILSHRLRREIIATELANDAVNRGGPSFITRQMDMTGRAPADVARAFAIVRDGYGLEALYSAIDALDNLIPGQEQLRLYEHVARLTFHATGWQLRNGDTAAAVGTAVEKLLAARRHLEPKLASLLPDFMKDKLSERQARMVAIGVPEALARSIAMLAISELVPDIMAVAAGAGVALDQAALVYFRATEHFRIGRIEHAARAISTPDYYDALALSRAGDMINAARRGIAMAALTNHGGDKQPFDSWVMAHETNLHLAGKRLATLLDSGELTISKLTVAAALMGDLASA